MHAFEDGSRTSRLLRQREKRRESRARAHREQEWANRLATARADRLADLMVELRAGRYPDWSGVHAPGSDGFNSAYRRHDQWLEALALMLREGDPAAVEAAVCFLEADPWFFRSGYAAGTIMRRLRSLQFAPATAERLRRVVLRDLAGPRRRWPRDYHKLALALDTPAFRQEITARIAGPDQHIRERFRYLLDVLEAGTTRVRRYRPFA